MEDHRHLLEEPDRSLQDLPDLDDQELISGAATANGFLAKPPPDSVSLERLIGSSVKSGIIEADIGEVEDILVSQDGELLAVMISVGDFSGDGTKEVAMDWNTIQFANKSDPLLNQPLDFGLSPGDYTVMINVTPEEFAAAPAFEHDWD